MTTKEVMLYSTSNAASQLQVSTRTIRKWIDQFDDYIQPECNDRGHYMLDQESLERLQDIKARLQEPNKTMKQVRDDLQQEQLLPNNTVDGALEDEKPISTKVSYLETQQTIHHVITNIEKVGDVLEDVVERLEQLEDHVLTFYNCFEKMEHKMTTLSYDSISGNDLQNMFDEIRKKQDQLKLELRNVHFTQRITAASTEATFEPRGKKKKGLFKLF